MGLHSAGFYRHYLKKEILLFTFGKRNCEMVDGDAKTTTSHNSFLFLTSNSVAYFLGRCIIIAVGSLRKSPCQADTWWRAKSHYRFASDIETSSVPGNLSSPSSRGVAPWDPFYTYRISGMIYKTKAIIARIVSRG